MEGEPDTELGSGGNRDGLAAGDPDRRPWGSFATLDEGPGYRVKRVTVDPGRQLDYRVRAERAQHWTVVVGRAVVELDGIPFTLRPGSTITIPPASVHRVENAGDGEMIFIEVQTGAQYVEDDIVGLEGLLGLDPELPPAE